MPKLKTNRSVKKRMRVSKNGKIKHWRSNKSHLLTGRRSKRKRLLGKAKQVSPGESKFIKLLLPYGA